MIEQTAKDITEEYLEEVVLRGTGFVDGKRECIDFTKKL